MALFGMLKVCYFVVLRNFWIKITDSGELELQNKINCYSRRLFDEFSTYVIVKEVLEAQSK